MTLFAQTVNHVLFHATSDTGLSQVLRLWTIIYAHQMAVSAHLLVMFPKTLKAKVEIKKQADKALSKQMFSTCGGAHER